MINNVTMLAIVLTGAALIREREHGTIEHLLVMPVTPFEIMASKVWAMGLVVLAACAFSLAFIVQGLLAVLVQGVHRAVPRRRCRASLRRHLDWHFSGHRRPLDAAVRTSPDSSAAALGVALRRNDAAGEHAGGLQLVMLMAPTTHFVMLAQAILYRGADLSAVWPQFLALAGIGAALLALPSYASAALSVR